MKRNYTWLFASIVLAGLMVYLAWTTHTAKVYVMIPKKIETKTWAGGRFTTETYQDSILGEQKRIINIEQGSDDFHPMIWVGTNRVK